MFDPECLEELEDVSNSIDQIILDLKTARGQLDAEIADARAVKQYGIAAFLCAEEQPGQGIDFTGLLTTMSLLPDCPWCKNKMSVIGRDIRCEETKTFLARCPCRVICLQAKDFMDAAKQLQSPGETIC